MVPGLSKCDYKVNCILIVTISMVFKITSRLFNFSLYTTVDGDNTHAHINKIHEISCNVKEYKHCYNSPDHCH